MTPNVLHLRKKLKSFRQKIALLEELSPDDVRELNRQWLYWARGDQQLPQGDLLFRNWLIMGGRGAGKTRAGAEWIRALALGLFAPHVAMCKRIAIVAPTFHEARSVMIEGISGLLSVHHPDECPTWEPSKRLLTWKNGTVAQVFSAEEPESLRGPQFDAAWCDELGKWKKASDVWSNLQMALRLGARPHAVITTTPRTTSLMRSLLIDAGTVVTRSKTLDNAAHLAPSFLADVMERYGSTTLGRQELDGELIAEDPNALWSREIIDRARVKKAPSFKRIVVAVDPPATSGVRANACGIVCAALGDDGRAYVLDDRSVKRLKPLQWAKRVVALYHARKADRIVAESNQGGEMVREVVMQADPTVPLRLVSATRSKRARAEPIAALYEQGRVSHVGAFPELEDEMCSLIGTGESPDRLDALVWALTELMLRKGGEPRVRVV